MSDRVLVRMQEWSGGKCVRTQSFRVRGHTFEEISDVIELYLGKKFGDAADPDRDIVVEEEGEDQPRARPTVAARTRKGRATKEAKKRLRLRRPS